MAIRMMSGLPARVIQVLTDYLPAELDLIDAEEADGLTTPDILEWHAWDIPVITHYPAVSIRTASSDPVEVRTTLMGERIDAGHRIDVMFHAIHETAGGLPQDLQKLMHRYITGAVRVLCVTKEALQTIADPTRFVELVEWAEEATYGPEVAQESGAIVRTATLPINIRRRESRT